MKVSRAVLRATFASTAASLVLAAGAGAATIQVTTTVDEDDGVPSESGLCSLREAISSAGIVPGPEPGDGCDDGALGHDEITFAPAISGGAQITLNLGELVLAGDDLTITGPGMDELELIGNPAGGRILNVNDSSIDVEIYGLSMSGGLLAGEAPTNGGGAILNSSVLLLEDVRVAGSKVDVTAPAGMLGQDTIAEGGGIYNNSNQLTLRGSIVEGNQALAENSEMNNEGAIARGGGIYSEGPLSLFDSTVDDNLVRANDDVGATSPVEASGAGLRVNGFSAVGSTISRNDAEAEPGASAGTAQGGGLFSVGAGVFELSTLAENRVSVSAEPAAVQRGGGIAQGGASLTIVSSTIARNGPAATSASAVVDGANIDGPMGPVQLRNSIVADPFGAGTTNCGGAVTSLGFNFESSPGTSCGLLTPNGQTGNPLLGSLQDNGGLTETIALGAGSPAIDAGDNSGQQPANLSRDQRGFTRPVDLAAVPNASGSNGTDIGAFEVPPPPPSAPAAAVAAVPAAAVPVVAAKKKCKKGRKLKRGKCVRKKKRKR